MRSWSEAWEDALFGPSGFFLRERPLDHFRTNVAVPLFAVAVRRLAELVDGALGHPDPFDVVDLGAGRGELLGCWADVPARWRLTSVDLAPGFPSEVPDIEGLLIANEYLDTVPLDVLSDGRLVLVDADGSEQLGAPFASEWADAWWPRDPSRPERGGASPGLDSSQPRVEVGASRDLAWSTAVSRVRRGLAVAVDYGHTMADRRPTLTGYREGRQVAPVPDGSCDLTAHVALDSAAAATGSAQVSQREALQALGVSAALPPAVPVADLALTSNSVGMSVAAALTKGSSQRIQGGNPPYGVLLERASQARELLDPDGLGGFGWLLRAVDVEVGWMGV